MIFLSVPVHSLSCVVSDALECNVHLCDLLTKLKSVSQRLNASIPRNVMSIHVICGQVENQADGHYTYGDHASKRNVMLTETKSEKNVQRLTLQVRGMYRGQTLQVKGMFRGQTLHL